MQLMSPAAAPDDEGAQLQYGAEQEGAARMGQAGWPGSAEEEEHGEQGAQEDQGPQVPLTPTIQAGAASMQQRKAAIEQQVGGRLLARHSIYLKTRDIGQP